MKRIWGHIVVGAAVAGGAAASSSACVHDDSSLFIRDVLAPPQSSGAGGTCLYTSDPTQPSLSQGVLDVGLASSYVAPLLVGNQVEPQYNQASQRTETSRIEIQGAVVRVTDATGNQLTTYTTLGSTTIDPNQGSQPSYSTLFVTLVDPATAGGQTPAPGAQRSIVSYVRVFGQTLGGQHVESNEFEYPITLCYGCLVSFPPSQVNLQLPTPNCVGNGSAGGGAVTTPCIFGQDQFVDCSLCAYSKPAVCNPGAQGIVIVDAGAGG